MFAFFKLFVNRSFVGGKKKYTLLLSVKEEKNDGSGARECNDFVCSEENRKVSGEKNKYDLTKRIVFCLMASTKMHEERGN